VKPRIAIDQETVADIQGQVKKNNNEQRLGDGRKEVSDSGGH